jgi:hypothetical protein
MCGSPVIAAILIPFPHQIALAAGTPICDKPAAGICFVLGGFVMSHGWRPWIVAVVVCLVIQALAQGDEGGGWKMPNLNPFAQPAGPPTSSRVSSGSGLKMPKLWSTTTTKKTSVSKKAPPSTWQKMSSGAKSMAAKTADALNPFDDAKDNEPIRITGSKTTGSKTTARKVSAKKDEQSGSWFPSLWPKEEPRPKTVNDFLNGKRPQP